VADLPADEISFLKAGILWDLEKSAERGTPLMML